MYNRIVAHCMSICILKIGRETPRHLGGELFPCGLSTSAIPVDFYVSLVRVCIDDGRLLPGLGHWTNYNKLFFGSQLTIRARSPSQTWSYWTTQVLCIHVDATVGFKHFFDLHTLDFGSFHTNQRFSRIQGKTVKLVAKLRIDGKCADVSPRKLLAWATR